MATRGLGLLACSRSFWALSEEHRQAPQPWKVRCHELSQLCPEVMCLEALRDHLLRTSFR